MFAEFQNVLQQGGFILWGLIALGIGLYSMLASTWFGLQKVKQGALRTSAAAQDLVISTGRRVLIRDFAILELDQLAWVERRLPFIGVLAGAAPLAGLLGTVSGMLATFAGLASSSSKAEPIDRISVGISEALITTQAGLLIAIPAAFLLAILRSQTLAVHGELQQQLHHQLVIFEQNESADKLACNPL